MLRDLGRGGRLFVVVVGAVLGAAVAAMCIDVARREGWRWLIAFVVLAFIGLSIKIVSAARDVPSKRRR